MKLQPVDVIGLGWALVMLLLSGLAVVAAHVELSTIGETLPLAP